jgi:flagellar hook-associated protein FlgK
MFGLDSALQGLGRAQASFDRAAERIAQPISLTPENPQDQVSLSDEMVALMTARNDFEANLQTIKTADKMQKTLLNVLG